MPAHWVLWAGMARCCPFPLGLSFPTHGGHTRSTPAFPGMGTTAAQAVRSGLRLSGQPRRGFPAGRALPHGPAKELPEEKTGGLVREGPELHCGTLGPGVQVPRRGLCLVRLRPSVLCGGPAGEVGAQRPPCLVQPGPSTTLLPVPYLGTRTEFQVQPSPQDGIKELVVNF